MTIKQFILSFVVLFLILLYHCEAFSSININPQLYKTKLAKFTLFELKVAVYNDISSKHTQRHEIKTQYKLENSNPKEISLNSLNLPILNEKDIELLNNGEHIQKQIRDGRSGTGWVVLSVDSPPDLVFSKLADFMSYVDMIPTVRSVGIYNVDRELDQYKVEYSLSKFKLKASVVQNVDHRQRIIRFSLDDDRPNIVFKKAEGFWFVEQIGDSLNPFRCRVWLKASITTTRLVPTIIVDYAACRALPRATNWIQPYFAQLQQDQHNSCVI